MRAMMISPTAHIEGFGAEGKSEELSHRLGLTLDKNKNDKKMKTQEVRREEASKVSDPLLLACPRTLSWTIDEEDDADGPAEFPRTPGRTTDAKDDADGPAYCPMTRRAGLSTWKMTPIDRRSAPRRRTGSRTRRLMAALCLKGVLSHPETFVLNRQELADTTAAAARAATAAPPRLENVRTLMTRM